METRSEARAGVRWLGHATALIELDGMRVMTDPVLRNRVGPLVRVAPLAVDGAIDRLDGVLLSHLHADHADLPSLRRIPAGTPLVAPYPAGAWLARKGVRDVQELRSGERMTIGSLEVTATHVTHDGRRRPFGPAADPIGYLLRGSRTFYFPGDTDLDPSMVALRGAVDVALIPVWGWGRSLGPGHLDPRRAATAVALIAPSIAIPIHWGTFALSVVGTGRSDVKRPAMEFAAMTRRYAPAVDVRVLAPGERIEL